MPNAALKKWFSENQRPLPWRGKNATPYRVWISEIMLQQTQVAKVIPYFERFIAKFPDAKALCKAKEEDVLALWAGLGYYSRARLLHRAAKECGGELPKDAAGWRALPGVGRYTLGAVRSIAYGESLPLVDGNVLRVLARIFGEKIRRGEPKGEARIWAHAEALIAKEHEPGTLNQALMELGALVCTPKNPRCLLCPVQSDCAAFASGTPEKYPLAKIPPARKSLILHVAWAEHAGKVLTHLRPPRGLWAGMRVLPAAASTQALAKLCAELTGGKARLGRLQQSAERALTHRDVTLHLHHLHIANVQKGEFVAKDELALPSAFAVLM